jgi:hypothetical protein
MRRLTSEQLDRIDSLVERYRARESSALEKEEDPYEVGGALKDCRIQHTHMARGGDGGSSGSGLLGEPSIRSAFYPGHPNVKTRAYCMIL